MSFDWREFEEKVETCPKCRLSETRKNAVPGSGDYDADIMFIGEAPGSQEDEEGEPFVGRAGGVLDDLFASIGIKRNQVYITNILKCRPPENRDPRKDEMEACTPYLDKQVKVVNPKVIATLGNFATKYIMNNYGLDAKSIGKVHGEVFTVNNLVLSARIVPQYHPAATMYNPNMEDTLKEDFKVLKRFL